MTGRKLQAVCNRLGSEVNLLGNNCWPILVSSIVVGLLSSGFIVTASGTVVSNHAIAGANNNHVASVTSPPFVSAAAEAAAAAALGGIDVGRSLVTALLGSPSTTAPKAPAHQTVIKMSGGQIERASLVQQKQQATSAPQQVVATLTLTAQSTTKPPAVLVKPVASTSGPLTISIVHKHSGKVINVSDTLHKLDLFIDPVCDQINKLTNKQLSKVHVQLRQFSQMVSKLETDFPECDLASQCAL